MKLIIADDDEQIREGIKEGIDWGSLGIDEVIPASNGIEALDLFTRNLPEIVVTDIRMPGMDGLMLFKQIKKIKPTTKVVIISGFSDFEYLKTAIRFGAVDYVLKPIKVRNLITLIKRIMDEILKEKVSEENFNKYLETYKKNLFIEIFSGKVSDRNIILEGLEQYFGFDGRGVLFCILLEIDNFSSWAKNRTSEELEKPGDIIRDLAEKSLFITYKGFFYKYEKNSYIMILKTIDSALINTHLRIELEKFIAQLNARLDSDLGLYVSGGISGMGNAAGIHTLYGQALEALESKLYSGRKSVNYYKASSATERNNLITRLGEKDLENGILNFDLDLVNDIIGRKFDMFDKERCYSKETIIHFCVNIVSLLYKILKETSTICEEYIIDKIEILKDAGNFETLKDYRNFVLDVYKYVFEEYTDLKNAKCNVIIFKAVEHIKENYYKDLTIETLAEFVGKTPNYFSHLFKKEFGMTFSEYVNRIRIGKAKEMILNTNLLVYEIAEKVGYREYAYFVQVFKKIEGRPPTNIRKGNP